VELGNLTGLLRKIKPAIDAVPADASSASSKDSGYVDRVAEANVRVAMRQILERSPILREMVESGQAGLVGGMYDLATGEVRFFDK
jgi:carbonic anhydrase